MPRSFDVSADFPVTVDAVLQAFGDEQYWLARLAESGADDAILDAMDCGAPDGSIDVVTTQVLRRDRLPGVVTQFHRGDLRIRREERWAAIADGASSGTVTGSILDAPALLTGEATLAPLSGSGTARLSLRATVEVKVPLVGGKLENFIGGQLAELLIAEQRFTMAWIDRTG